MCWVVLVVMDRYSPRGPLEQMAAQTESFRPSAPPSGPSSDVVSLCPAQDSLSPELHQIGMHRQSITLTGWAS